MFYKLVISINYPTKLFQVPSKCTHTKCSRWHRTKCFFPNKVASQTEFSRNKVNLPPQTKTCCFLWQQQQKQQQQVRPLCEAAEQSREQLPAFAVFHSFHASFKRSLRIWGIPSFLVFRPDFIGGLKMYADFYRKHAKLRTCLRNHSWMLGVHKKTNKRLPLLPGPPINQSMPL